MQRMAGGKGILTLAGKRDAVNVAQHRPAVRTGLVEQKLHPVRQQRCRNRDQQGMVAGAPQGLALAARGEPAGRRQNQKDLLVRAPGQCACDML